MRHRESRVVALVVAVVFAANVGLVNAAVDKREMQGREAFAAGRYDEALELFAKLYAEKLHPNYLRNIGRCYQNMGEPDKAIASFKEYLRKAKTIKPDERAEVEGYIKEMEDLKRQKEAEAAERATPNSPPTAARTASPSGASMAGASAPLALGIAPATAANESGSQPSAMLVGSAQTRPLAEESHPVYTRWWFWTLIGGVVVGGVAAAAALGAFTRTQEPPCMAGMTCGQ